MQPPARAWVCTATGIEHIKYRDEGRVTMDEDQEIFLTINNVSASGAFVVYGQHVGQHKRSVAGDWPVDEDQGVPGS